MAAPVPNPQPYPEIPDKLYFRIGEVSQLAGVKPYVLRYWETEFAGIGPKKSGSNHRLYRRKDVELILDIKHLLYEKRYTIEGARKLLMGEGRAAVRAENARAENARAESARVETARAETARVENARAETRGLAKPVQAVSTVAAPVAVAVGSAGTNAPQPMAATSLVPTAAATPNIVSTPSAPAGALGVSSNKRSSSLPKPAAPNPDLVGSIRKELLSLLDLLSN